ncbi:hypothetical protein [Paenibacillus sp. MSJ-34]|uniref:hypothetical protein n=1 Tax=Paenibacillus sp. MSJ-34 TaxID=2841529 RepID=UPI001C1289DC|nr:hypothetical protein [Paenibacillus sp. MSJ-34]MBU5442837.1 hypothetical protein [Paenibacillus sp. MSJ-34]
MKNDETEKTNAAEQNEPTIVWETANGREERDRSESGHVIPFPVQTSESSFVRLHIPLEEGRKPLVITRVSSGFGNVQATYRSSAPRCAA